MSSALFPQAPGARASPAPAAPSPGRASRAAGEEAGGAAADLVAAARRVAAEVLAPAAEATDQGPLVPGANLDALAAAGLYGLHGPEGQGGAAAPPWAARAVVEALAGACGATWFVWAQHHTPVRALAATPNGALRDRHLAPLCRGDLRGGIAFAYLRRPGPAAVTARPVPGGWQVDGEAPWLTGWGLVGLLLVAAVLPGDRVLWFCLPATASTRVRPSAPLALAAMGATGTVRLRFDRLLVSEDAVVEVEDLERWRARDRIATAQPSAAVLGLAAACVARLAEQPPGSPAGGSRSEATAPGSDGPSVAAVLGDELRRCQDHAYALADAGGTDQAALGRLVDARAWSLDLALRAAQTLVAATGGRALERGHPAQRLLREAAFQAQTSAGRAASLARVARASTRVGPGE